VPKWSTVEGRLSGRVPGGLRLTVRGYTQALIEQPGFNTNDPSNLYWTARDFAEGRLEGGHDDLSYYAVYTYRSDRNVARAAEVTTGQYTLGAAYQLSPTLNMFAEYHHELWSGKAAITGYPSIGNYLPDVTTGILQMTYNPNKRAYLSLTYTGFGTRNDNPLMLPDGNTRGTFVTINGRYKFNRGY
jgi:predicted porin